MTKFENIGVTMQNEAVSIEDATKKFAYSCNICCHRGLHIDCDHCAIAMAHNLTVANFNDYAQAEKDAKERKEAEAKAKAEAERKAMEKFEKAMAKLTKELDLDEITAKIRELNHYLDVLERARESAEHNYSRKKEFESEWYRYEDEYLDNWDRG